MSSIKEPLDTMELIVKVAGTIASWLVITTFAICIVVLSMAALIRATVECYNILLRSFP